MPLSRRGSNPGCREAVQEQCKCIAGGCVPPESPEPSPPGCGSSRRGAERGWRPPSRNPGIPALHATPETLDPSPPGVCSRRERRHTRGDPLPAHASRASSERQTRIERGIRSAKCLKFRSLPRASLEKPRDSPATALEDPLQTRQNGAGSTRRGGCSLPPARSPGSPQRRRGSDRARPHPGHAPDTAAPQVPEPQGSTCGLTIRRASRHPAEPGSRARVRARARVCACATPRPDRLTPPPGP